MSNLTLQEMIEEALAEYKHNAEFWEKEATRCQRNTEYYVSLLDDIARTFGKRAFISDDGSVQQDPIRAKMPELVRNLESERQYHMNSINRLAKQTGFDGTSIIVVEKTLEKLWHLKNNVERLQHLEKPKQNT